MLTEFQIETAIGMQQSSFMALQTTYLAWGTIFTIVFAYLAALYFFLRHAGLFMKIMGYAAFSLVLFALVWTTNIHFQQSVALVDVVVTMAEQGIVPEMTDMGSIDTSNLPGVVGGFTWAFNIFFLGVIGAFGYVTFWYRWPDRNSGS